MKPRIWAACAAVAFCVAVSAGQPKADAKQDGKKAESKSPFGLAKVHKLHLSLTAKEWGKLQPAAPKFPWMPGGAAKAQEKADTHKGGVGTEFPWTRGELTIDGKTYKNVGLRYKGNFTYMASSTRLKRPFKIHLARHEAGQSFFGLKRLNLNNGVTDASKARESLSSAFFQAAGVPAPRTAFAELTLTVPGKYDKEYVGLYTLRAGR
jgi:hypothetical protein